MATYSKNILADWDFADPDTLWTPDGSNTERWGIIAHLSPYMANTLTATSFGAQAKYDRYLCFTEIYDVNSDPEMVGSFLQLWDISTPNMDSSGRRLINGGTRPDAIVMDDAVLTTSGLGSWGAGELGRRGEQVDSWRTVQV